MGHHSTATQARASDRAQKKVKFCRIFRDKYAEESVDFAGILHKFSRKLRRKAIGKNGRFCAHFQGKFH